MAEGILACGACLRRAMQLVPQQRFTLQRVALLQARPATRNPTQRRFASVEAQIKANPDAAQTLDVAEETASMAQKRSEEKLQRAVKKQLSYMDDPWKIGKYVEEALSKDRFDEAYLLVQTASKDGQVVVAWNHLIDYKLKHQQLRVAIKMYNEMKKRGQLPNVQTYTILFRGCAKSEHPQLAVSEAIKHYHILMKDARLEPNSIHLNAVLNVCGKANDLDSMFAIVDSVNDTTRPATAYTYTVILNALRFSLMREMKDFTPEQIAANTEKTVNRGKALWEEVIDKWQKGRLVIDEELVCAMGRLINMIPERDAKHEILDLLEQTMNIPNIARPKIQEKPSDYGTKNDAAESSKAMAHSHPASGKGLYCGPGRNTLGLVLTILASGRMTTFGIKYWNVFVRQHGIVPDKDNWFRMLGMLKVAKASAHAAEILDILPDEYVNSTPYRIAMETCVRDNINPNAVKNANRVLNSMLERLPVPDAHVLRSYLRVSLVSHYAFRVKSTGGDQAGARSDYGRQITEALVRLWEPYQKLHNHFFKVVVPKTKAEEGVLYNDKREAIALARIMYSSFSKVIEERLLPEDDLKEMRPLGAKINREIQSFFLNRDELEPNIRKAKTHASSDMQDYEYKPAGDFVWDTSKPDQVVTRRDRGRTDDRQDPAEGRGGLFQYEPRKRPAARDGRPPRDGVTPGERYGRPEHIGVTSMERNGRGKIRRESRDPRPERGFTSRDGRERGSRAGRPPGDRFRSQDRREPDDERPSRERYGSQDRRGSREDRPSWDKSAPRDRGGSREEKSTW
ncbi:hypothetical protein G7046_g3830 [Stylonectria norvegica]|nr:hypothetical protein G7046_g3830 [Stylonectria norvegica]